MEGEEFANFTQNAALFWNINGKQVAFSKKNNPAVLCTGSTDH